MSFKISKEELYNLYINNNLTILEIANLKDTTQRIIQRRLNKYNIKKSKELFYKKNKEILLKKYGIENVSQLKDVKEKKKQKSLEKYGVKNISQAQEIKIKKEKKALEKFGVSCILQSEDIKRKIKEKILGKYGVDNVSKIKKIREKAKSTMLKKYGVEYPGQLEEFKKKIRKTNLERYGVECVLQLEEIKSRIKKANLKKYGSESILSNSLIKEKIKKTNLEKYNVPYACMLKQCREANKGAISKINKKFSKRLDKNDIKNKLEFNLEKFSYDIQLLDSNILIEINPTYTHNITFGSEFRGHKKQPLTKEYHYEKTLNAKENGYKCIHIFDWDDKDKIIDILKPKDVIPARLCTIRNVNIKETEKFLNKYHLQGYCKGQDIRLGLFYNDKLVEIMTFGKPRYNKKYQYELLRLCSINDYYIIGGSNKLFKNFIKKYNPESIISYCDNSKFDGNVYNNLGFQLLDYGKPSKHWYNEKTKKHITDNLLRQRGFDQLFKANYGKGTSNKELMIQHGFVEIYDCGQSVYIYNKST